MKIKNQPSRKKLLLIVFVLLILIFSFLRIRGNFTEYVWVSPQVNTTVFPYINKSISQLNKGINTAINNANSQHKNMKLLYQNAYGSGFLNNNTMPNDLDYSIGVHLGQYEYDGKNEDEIAKSLEDKMSTFQIELYDYISNLDDNSLIANHNLISSIIMFEKQKKSNIENIKTCLKEISKDKEYIIHTTKILDDKKNMELKFPFVLKPNEILVQDYSPIMLFTEEMSYDKIPKRYLREITIVIDYFVDIKDAKTQKNKTVEIVSESFVGQRLQLSRRFFVPIVFIGENSANYLSKLDILNDKDKYLEYRMFNYKRHLQEFANLNQMKDQPVKLLKRIAQCKELILPVLEVETQREIDRELSINFQNKDLQIMNDYSNALGNLIQISQLEKVYNLSSSSGKTDNLLTSMKDNLTLLKERGNVNKENLNHLFGLQIWIENSKSTIRTNRDLKKFSNELLDQMSQNDPYIKAIYKDLIKNQDMLISYVELFSSIYQNSGFHRVEIYWLDKNTLGVVKDSFTSGIKPKDLKKVALENGLADVNYKFISQDKIPQMVVRHAFWMRYNPSEKEEAYWAGVKSKLLKDKDNFAIKRKIVF